jgi:short-subunit dehydrogenase
MPRPYTVVITGGSAGVGRATAIAFARRGWNVVLIARGQERLEAARQEAAQAGAAATLAIAGDVADAEGIFAAADQVSSSFGGIDVWINNAMVTVLGEVAQTTPDEIRRVTEVTYLGAVHGTMAAMRYMRPRNRGTIVQIGSALAYRAIPLQAAYCAGKFALRGFTDSLRSELLYAGSALRLTMVQLPAVDTPQFDWARNHMPQRPRPVPPVFTPRAVAEGIYRAALSAPREVWIGGPTVQAIVGHMAAPGLLDRYLALTAYDGQLTEEPKPEGPNNLFAPVPGQQGAQGRFGEEAQRSVRSFNPAGLRVAAGLLGLGVLSGAWLLGRARLREGPRCR